MKKLLVIGLLFVGYSFTQATTDDTIVFFEGTYDEALKAARKQKKPIFLDFYADWCSPCKQMEKYSFSDPEFSDIINEEFIAFKVNVDYFWGMDVADIYGIKNYPTIIFTDKKGREIRRAVGFKTADELEKLANMALKK